MLLVCRDGPFEVVRVCSSGTLKLRKGFYTLRLSIHRRCSLYKLLENKTLLLEPPFEGSAWRTLKRTLHGMSVVQWFVRPYDYYNK
jgi:hypothetical protein